MNIIKRLLNLDREKIGRHLGWLVYSLRCRFKRLYGRGYPLWIDRVSTHLTFEEKQTLFDLGSQLAGGSIIVEIGSYHGASAACLAAASINQRIPIYCIDTWMNDAVSDDRGDTLGIFLKNVQPVGKNITCVRGYSFDVFSNIPDKIDLLFIDGDHSYEGVKKDLQYYLPKMNINGMLIMHDYSFPAVRLAIEQYVFPAETKRYILLPNLYAGRVNKRYLK